MPDDPFFDELREQIARLDFQNHVDAVVERTLLASYPNFGMGSLRDLLGVETEGDNHE